MTQKDFELIAKSLNGSLQAAWAVSTANYGAVLATIEDMADALTTTNPRFDRERFIAAATK